MKNLVAGMLLLAAVVSGPVSGVQDRGNGSANGPLVKTADGAVRGFTRDAVDWFLGIPYATPPVGELRWRPPQPVQRWRGVLDATRFASTCPQVTTLGVFAGPTSITEDCLYLNVFTAGKKGGPGHKKPVIVWLHGGANIDGASNDYDGTKLATGGPAGVETIVVTLNYRLGILGIFSHPAINEGAHWGNFITLDHQAALRWVQRNIEAFGGDPQKVTIAGQSAGQTDVMVNVLSPLSKGLFHRAIAVSSPGFTAWLPTAELTQTLGTNFATAAGCPGSDATTAKCLRELPVARMLQLQGTLSTGGPFTTGFQFVDGTIVPMRPEEAYSSGNFNKVPLMGGGTKDEASFFSAIALYFNTAAQPPKTPADYARLTAPGMFCIWCNAERKMPPGVGEAYPLSEFDGDSMAAYAKIGTDGGRCRELHVLKTIAAHAPVYAYDFTYREEPFYFPKYPSYKPNAVHTGDLQFVFNDYHGGHLGVNLDQGSGMPRRMNAAETKLSDQMVAAWTRFAATGNPNDSGDSPWPRFTPDDAGRYLIQDIPLSTKTVAQFRSDYKCDFFDPQLKY